MPIRMIQQPRAAGSGRAANPGNRSRWCPPGHVVTVLSDQGWRFTALHNGRVRPVRIPAPDSMPSRLAQAMGRTAHRLGMGRATARA